MKPLLIGIFLLVWPIAVLAVGDEPHWDYEGEEGPDRWGELAPKFDICSRGKNQSPIDLLADADADLPELHFDYLQRGRLVEVNTGHAIQENVTAGNFVVIRGRHFELKQFHFHSPSEHTVGGENFPMEVHFVHEGEDGVLVVVGLMFELGEHNPLMDNLPSFRAERGENPFAESFDFNEMITERGNNFLYNGSLTTPPCSEGVQWIVMKTPIVASEAQIQHYHDLLGFDNNRPVQPHNARVILE